MSKNWIFTPAFCKYRMLEECLDHIYCVKNNTEGFQHVIIDQHYPVEELENSRRIRELANAYGCTYVDSLFDRGLHHGLNNAIRLMQVEIDDTLIGCDPDDRPSHGAFHALKKVMDHNTLIAVCGLNFHVLPWKQKETKQEWPVEVIAGEKVWLHPSIEMFNIAAFNLKLLHMIGGFSQPNAYYGGIEVELYKNWLPLGMRLAYLIDHTSEAKQVDRTKPELYDESYGKWKIAHACNGYVHSYAQWLKDNALILPKDIC